MTSDQIIDRIEAHAARTGLEPSTICQYAVRNSALYRRLKDGGECLPRTSARLLRWIEANAAASDAA
ncbi:MAG: hypothetical protein V2I43_10490 [Parvularcula sp.]|jgi:hypothetical protein|nr:hypothetical protein [Parvularcula sp.]